MFYIYIIRTSIVTYRLHIHENCNLQKNLQQANKKATIAENVNSWGAVINYVDEITTGVKDDEDPRFAKSEKQRRPPPDCFPKMIYTR